jgi:thiosulfate dehydrogenase (quinone) large subunit
MTSSMTGATGRATLFSLLLLRLYTGVSLFFAGLAKAQGGFLGGDKLAAYLRTRLGAGTPYDFFEPFLRDVVVPHVKLFSWLVAGGELCGGACLALGLLTRPAALGSLLMLAGIALCEGEIFWKPGTAVAFVLITFALLLTAPGRFLGLDAALRKKLPRWLV